MAVESVTVACRLPHGLHLDLMRDGKRQRHTIAGANRSRLVNGAGITSVPKEFWDAWLAKHKDMPFVRNGAVFAARSESDAAQEADQRSGDRTGFEGAEPGDVDRRLAELARE